MHALRLTDGVALTLFSERTGLPVTVLQSGLNEARQRGLLSTDPKLLVASAQGQLFLNDLLQIFLTPER